MLDKNDSDSSDSVYQSDPDDPPNQGRDEVDYRELIIYYFDMWQCYWKKRFFRQVVRSTIVFFIGLKLLGEIKGLEVFSPKVPD